MYARLVDTRRESALLGDGIAVFSSAFTSAAGFTMWGYQEAPVALGVGVFFAAVTLMALGRWYYDLVHRT